MVAVPSLVADAASMNTTPTTALATATTAGVRLSSRA